MSINKSNSNVQLIAKALSPFDAKCDLGVVSKALS